jgi:hypothetical protein
MTRVKSIVNKSSWFTWNPRLLIYLGCNFLFNVGKNMNSHVQRMCTCSPKLGVLVNIKNAIVLFITESCGIVGNHVQVGWCTTLFKCHVHFWVGFGILYSPQVLRWLILKSIWSPKWKLGSLKSNYKKV